jgi:hypothetical protein
VLEWKASKLVALYMLRRLGQTSVGDGQNRRGISDNLDRLAHMWTLYLPHKARSASKLKRHAHAGNDAIKLTGQSERIPPPGSSIAQVAPMPGRRLLVPIRLKARIERAR